MKKKVPVEHFGNIRDTDRKYWQVYGVRARLQATSLEDCLNKIQNRVKKESLPYKITIVSPQEDVWVIGADKKISLRNCKKTS